MLEARHFEERGNAVMTVAILLGSLLCFGALAVDLSSLFLVRNELQNAADAGALAGARRLYLADGSGINSGANAIAVAAATANNAQGVAVEVVANPAGNSGDVQRGHWRWTDHSFTPNDSLAGTILEDQTNADLDADMDFINAVRVRVHRETTPAHAFLSKVMGFNNFPMQAEAIAYIGFAGSFLPGEADEPIAICRNTLLNDQGGYSCNTGRMINSGGSDTHNTGGWTNFTQEPCETASSSSVRPYVGCGAIPSPEITLQINMGTTGGQVQNAFDDLEACWLTDADTNSDGRPDTVYNMTLPVIECPSNNVDNCSDLVGAVNVNMIWMVRQANSDYDWVPTEMTGPAPFPNWACPAAITGGLAFPDLSVAQREACWVDFVDHFGLVNYLGDPVTTITPISGLNKTLYFQPDCAAHVPVGVTAGPNLGVLAKIPVLVQ